MFCARQRPERQRREAGTFPKMAGDGAPMTSRSHVFACLVAWLAALACSPAPMAAQGTLDRFAADVSAPSDPPRSRSCGDSSCDGFSDFCGEIFAVLFQYTLLYGGISSWERVDSGGAAEPGSAHRALGEPLLPFARLDLAYQSVESDVDAMDVRAELGYGPFAAQVDLTRYWEETPSDEMNLLRALAVYRMAFGANVETDLGFGVLTLEGDERTSRFLFSLPVLVHPSPHWGIEFRPAWADRVSDYDLALLLTRGCTSLKLGYRWLDSPRESLDGPYVGVSIRL